MKKTAYQQPLMHVHPLQMSRLICNSKLKPQSDIFDDIIQGDEPGR